MTRCKHCGKKIIQIWVHEKGILHKTIFGGSKFYIQCDEVIPEPEEEGK